MKKYFFILVILIATVFSTPIFANVISFNLSVNTTGANPIISYRLNETCSAVAIKLYGPLPDTTLVRTISAPTLFGLNSVSWDMKDDSGSYAPTGGYSFSVVASDAVGHTAWTQISNDSTTTFQFYSPRGGVRVNNNIGSPYFGLAYISNGGPGQVTDGRYAAKGIFAVYPDGADPFNQDTTPATGGVDWLASNSNSPYQVFVGPDDKIWISDWSDGHSGVWRANPDLSGTWTLVLDTTGRTSSGLCPATAPYQHGSISGIFVEGTDTTTILYTLDEDVPGGATGTDPQLYSIWKFNVGTGPFPITTLPTIWVDDSSNFSGCVWVTSNYGLFPYGPGAHIAHDSLGRWWTNSYRAATPDGWPTIVVLNPSRDSVVWDSKTYSGNTTINDPTMPCLGGFAIDEQRNRVFVSHSSGFGHPGSGFTVFPFDPLPGISGTTTLDGATTNVVAGTTGTSRGIDVDAAGNVYYLDSGLERLKIFSPPDGPNSYTTDGSVTIPISTPVSIFPSDPISITKGGSKVFTAYGGILPYTFSLSNDSVGSIITTANTATFSADSIGQVDLTVTDSTLLSPQSASVSITVIATSAPVFKDVETKKYIRFELFE